MPNYTRRVTGKHIAIKCPKNGGSLYYSYKGSHSTVLMALVDADYKFIWVDIRANGSASEAAMFNHSEMEEVIGNGIIGFPAAGQSRMITDRCLILLSEMMHFL